MEKIHAIIPDGSGGFVTLCGHAVQYFLPIKNHNLSCNDTEVCEVCRNDRRLLYPVSVVPVAVWVIDKKTIEAVVRSLRRNPMAYGELIQTYSRRKAVA